MEYSGIFLNSLILFLKSLPNAADVLRQSQTSMALPSFADARKQQCFGARPPRKMRP